MTVNFPGLAVAGYRSLAEPSMIDVRERFNVILGANNSGKSNILRILAHHLDDFYRSAIGNVSLTSVDARHDRARSNPGQLLKVYWPIDVDSAIAAAGGMGAQLSAVLESTVFRFLADTPLLELRESGESRLIIDSACVAHAMTEGAGLPWRDLSMHLSSTGGGQSGDDTARVLDFIRRSHLLRPPDAALVPPARSIVGGRTDGWDFSGAGIIERLDDLRNADFDAPEARETYRKLCDRLGDLLEEPQLDYVVPRGSDTVNIRLSGEYYPLQALGTGTAHVVLIVAAATVYPEHMLCLEEPDAHLHPRLQRRVATLLRTETRGKIVVATHSAHWIDLSTDNVLAVEMSEGSTQIEAMHYPNAFARLSALGYRASDLLQANAIVWVEGPSDRVYVNRWLALVDPSLIEGIHYSTMFFGGSLLSHLQAPVSPDYGDPDLVDLWRINQQMWLIVDSDKASADAPLKPRVERLRDDIRRADRGGLWVTAGRTIENYIPILALERAVRDVHPTVEKIDREGSSHKDLLSVCLTANGTYLKTVDKVAVASLIARNDDLDMSELDLRDQIQDLVDFIHNANEGRPGHHR